MGGITKGRQRVTCRSPPSVQTFTTRTTRDTPGLFTLCRNKGISRLWPLFGGLYLRSERQYTRFPLRTSYLMLRKTQAHTCGRDVASVVFVPKRQNFLRGVPPAGVASRLFVGLNTSVFGLFVGTLLCSETLLHPLDCV